jgi:hypothetical protein
MCKYCGEELHDVANWPDNHRDPPPNRSDHPAPYVQSDRLGRGINGLWHPITGQMIDSKSQFRAITKAHGCVEVGNERLQDRKEFRNWEPPVSEADVFNDVCAVLKERDVSVGSGELV